ncbi:hypothetical protein C8R47DRAFT_607847 [Mycena vitilis]|nr:hypothetical protein C8R47DRAFT_607847 [Mycena vitilis]
MRHFAWKQQNSTPSPALCVRAMFMHRTYLLFICRTCPASVNSRLALHGPLQYSGGCYTVIPDEKRRVLHGDPGRKGMHHTFVKYYLLCSHQFCCAARHCGQAQIFHQYCFVRFIYIQIEGRSDGALLQLKISASPMQAVSKRVSQIKKQVIRTGLKKNGLFFFFFAYLNLNTQEVYHTLPCRASQLSVAFSLGSSVYREMSNCSSNNPYHDLNTYQISEPGPNAYFELPQDARNRSVDWLPYPYIGRERFEKGVRVLVQLRVSPSAVQKDQSDAGINPDQVRVQWLY